MGSRRNVGRKPTEIGLYIALAIFILICVFGGGASRNDALSQPFVWVASILVGLAAALGSKALVDPELRAPCGFFLAMAAVMAAQLVPLPPGLWAALPGHDLFGQAAKAAGAESNWRPLSLTPDLTWASLLGMLPVFGLLLGYSALPAEWRRHSLTVLVVITLFSGALGLAQVTGGRGGGLRFYAITNPDAAVGMFANRNHQALLLAMGLPMLAVLSRILKVPAKSENLLRWSMLGAGLFLIPLLFVTGSRGGLLLLIIALPASIILARWKPAGVSHAPATGLRPKLIKWLPLLLIAAVIGAALLFARSSAFDRLAATTIAEEQRSRMLETLLVMAKSFFPFGAGFGSFDSVYRAFEPLELLNVSYMNQAHNDLAQLVIEGGLPGIVLLGAFLFWSVRRSLVHWQKEKGAGTNRLLGRLGSVLVALVLLSSLVDYPLRTPLIATVFALAVLWLAQSPDRASRTL